MIYSSSNLVNFTDFVLSFDYLPYCMLMCADCREKNESRKHTDFSPTFIQAHPKEVKKKNVERTRPFSMLSKWLWSKSQNRWEIYVKHIRRFHFRSNWRNHFFCVWDLHFFHWHEKIANLRFASLKANRRTRITWSRNMLFDQILKISSWSTR